MEDDGGRCRDAVVEGTPPDEFLRWDETTSVTSYGTSGPRQVGHQLGIDFHWVAT